MIKVLHKALNIIEFLAKYPDGKSLAEIAEAIGEKVTTTSNIVRVLAKRNYLEKAGKRWQLGIAAYMLTNATREYDKMLCDLAEPILKKLSVITGSSTVLSVWKNNERYVLLRVEDKAKIRVTKSWPEKGKVFKTLTGMTLLAYQPSDVIEEYIAKNSVVDGKKLTDEQIEEFKNILAVIKSKGYHIRDNGEGLAAAAPIFNSNGSVKIAIGLHNISSASVINADRIVEDIQKAAEALEKAIKNANELNM